MNLKLPLLALSICCILSIQGMELSKKRTLQAVEEAQPEEKKARTEAERYQNCSQEEKNTFLVKAAVDGNKREIQALIAAGADVNYFLDDKRPQCLDEKRPYMLCPLHIAVYFGHTDCIRPLVEAGASLESVTNCGCCLVDSITEAIDGDHVACIQELVALGAPIDNEVWIQHSEKHLYGTPLHFAAALGAREIVELLIALKAPINAVSELNLTPLGEALKAGNTAIAHLLLDAGATQDLSRLHPDDLYDLFPNKTVPGCLYGTALHCASYYGNLSGVKLLLAHGADVQSKNQCGRTPLFYASHPEVAHTLLAAGADIHERDNFHCTPLHTQLLHRPDKTIHPTQIFGCRKILIELGLDPEATDNEGLTPYQCAAAYGCYDMLPICLAQDFRAETKLIPFQLSDGIVTLPYCVKDVSSTVANLVEVVNPIEDLRIDLTSLPLSVQECSVLKDHLLEIFVWSRMKELYKANPLKDIVSHAHGVKSSVTKLVNSALIKIMRSLVSSCTLEEIKRITTFANFLDMELLTEVMCHVYAAKKTDELLNDLNTMPTRLKGFLFRSVVEHMRRKQQGTT